MRHQTRLIPRMQIPFEKANSAIIVICLGAALMAVAQTQSIQPAVGGYQIVSAGPHDRVWEQRRIDANEQTNRHSYTELATGLNFWDPASGSWRESREEFQIAPNGYAIGTNGQHKVIISPDIASEGAVDFLGPDGIRLLSSPRALIFRDTLTDKSTVLAEVTNCIGELSPPNVVVFPAAFDSVKAAVTYTYTRRGLAQDVILYQKLPLPSDYGFSDNSTVLEIWTEFLQSPVPAVSVSASTSDQTLDFGLTRMGAGVAYVQDPNELQPVAVEKSWESIGGHSFLIERISYSSLKPLLANLQASLPSAKKAQIARLVLRSRSDLVASFSSRKPQSVLLAGIRKCQSALKPGVVIDYQTGNPSLTNYTFASDMTYFISGPVSIISTNNSAAAVIIEGGACLKFTNGAGITMNNGTLLCKAAPYRVGILTSMHDDSCGEAIANSTGSPTNTGATFINGSTNGAYKYLRFNYAGTAIHGSVGDSAGGVWHCQFVKCGTGIVHDDGYVDLHNVLFSDCGYGATAFGNALGLRAQHVTADRVGKFYENLIGSPIGRLTNSVLTAVTNLGNLDVLDHCTTNSSSAGYYQTAGAGNYYLAAFSTNRNVGTNGISSSLSNDLRQLTTFPPLIYSNITITTNLTLAPQAQRDSDSFDLGYHYTALDYLTHLFTITNCSLTVAPGTAIACYNGAGIWAQEGSAVNSVGTPLTPNWFVRYQSVQEQAISLGSTTPSSGFSVNPYHTNTPAPTGTFRFTRFTCPANGGNHFYNSSWSFGNLLLYDSEVWGGANNFGGAAGSTTILRNNLFNRGSSSTLSLSSNTLSVSNNLFWSVTLLRIFPISSSYPWTVFNNVFDSCSFAASPGTVTNSGYNAYWNCDKQLNPTNASDITLGSPVVYQSGPLGDFYQTNTSPLINTGSCTANLSGLYHYTVMTNIVNGTQIKETNSVVDRGVHYVAVDTNGQPVDTDGGGAADWIENTAGDGATNNVGEGNWKNPSDDVNYLMQPGYLRCEYRVDPWGITTNYGQPRFFWILTSGHRAAKQLAYQVLVSTDTNLLNLGVGDMWDSGPVVSDQTVHVEYGGRPLQSGQRLAWKVRSVDLSTGISVWSTNAVFQIGFLDPVRDWDGAHWIGVNGYSTLYPLPMFRSPIISLPKQVATATAYVSAKGVYELWINGNRIGSHILAPEWTDIHTRIQYQTFDVTPYLNNGPNSNNIIGSFVGLGWAYGDVGNGAYNGTPNPQFLLRLNITNADGSSTNYFTDSTWSCSTNGPIISASIYDGETYDARREGASTNWSTPGYSPLYFTNLITTSAATNDASKLFTQPNEPIRATEFITPVAKWITTSNASQVVTIFDLGQLIDGWCGLYITNVGGLSGTVVTLRHAEVLVLDSNHLKPNGPSTANIYTPNLLDAAQQDSYTLNADATQQFQPHFTYHAFRFAEVSAPPSIATNLSLGSLTGSVIHSSVPYVGNFWCSDTNSCQYATNLISKLMTNIQWTLGNNLQSVFSSCGGRNEREGYFFDEHVVSQTACFEMDISAFLTKWIRDMRDAQSQIQSGNGMYTMYAPWDDLGLVPRGTQDTGCQIGGLIFPWRLYQNYADTRMLIEHYTSAQKWFGYLAHICTNVDGTWRATSWGYNSDQIKLTVTDWMEGDHFRGNGIGPSDWFQAPPDAAATWETWGNSWSAHSADILADISRILQIQCLSSGDSSSANTYSNNYTYYTNMAAKIRTAFTNAIAEIDGAGNIKSFLSPAFPGWHSTSQGDAVSVLNFDMIPTSQRANVLTNMLLGSPNTSGAYGLTNYNRYCSDGSKCSNHLSTGYALTARAMLELTRGGFTTNAYRVLTNAEFPSWLYMVTNGFTTMWEGWNTFVAGPDTGGSSGHGYNTAYGSMLCSFNHVAFGAVGEWIWKVMAGINPDDANPGFKNILIKPEPGGGITNVYASFDSIRGPVISSWTNNTSQSTFYLTITVPANSTAAVYIPSTNSLADINESGTPATNAAGVFRFYTTNPPSFTKGATVFHVGSGTYKFALTNY